MSFRSDGRQKKNSDKEYKYRNYFCYFCRAEKTPNNIKERDIIKRIQPKLKDFKIQNTLEEEILKEISILNDNLQTIYENYKKKNISKEEYLKEKTFIQDKKVLLVCIVEVVTKYQRKCSIS